MAVGYLAKDWRAEYVKTQDRGKTFVFAVHNFDQNNGSAVGVGFFNQEAFALRHPEEDRMMYAPELMRFFLEMVEDEEERDFEDEGDDYVTFIGEGGAEYEDINYFNLTDKDEVFVYYEDIASRYWR